MLQGFDNLARPEQGPPRLAALRALLAQRGLQGFIVPRADAHQGEYVAARDERLGWLTGFTGSAGFAVVLPDVAGVFIDGRYRTQVMAQVDLGHYTPVPWPDTKPGAWIAEHLAEGRLGHDPWLHTAKEIGEIEEALQGRGVVLVSCANPLDAIWRDQPAPPLAPVALHPIEFAGESSAAKRARLADGLRGSGARAAVLTLPDSICWLLNIRGADVPRNPVVHAFAILRDDASLDLFIAPAKLSPEVRAALEGDCRMHLPEAFAGALAALQGPVLVDPATAPVAVSDLLRDAGVAVQSADDPCRLPKARKNPAEIAGMEAAHLRDAVAMVEYLCWFDAQAPGSLTEIGAVAELERRRAASNAFRDLSFETICGAGPNGAIMHYRVTRETERRIGAGELVVLDSGAQYIDGTTDITRTLLLGEATAEQRACFTRVLKGMIAISRIRWPRGAAGRDLDPFARQALWLAGQDFDHGTGHGVGACLSVHEGPQRLSRISHVALEPGMILSNEPGYYREGAFGIRIENLVLVIEAPALPGGDAHRKWLGFRTLTFVPIERRLVEPSLLTREETDWLDAYHSEVRRRTSPLLSDAARAWLIAATAPL